MANEPEESTVAQVIYSQLGHRTFKMLGAHTLIDHGNALSFKIRGSRKVNYVKITLKPDDTYTVEFKKLGRAPGFKVKDVARLSGIYVDQLHELIEYNTGLYTRLNQN